MEATDENRLATPATACSDVSNDSFFADNFIGEVTVSTPKSKAGASSDMGCSTVSPTSALYATLSPDKLASLIEEKEMENIDKVKDDITDDGELSDPDDENYWYNSLLPMKKKKSTKEKGESKTTNQTEKNDDIVITAKSILCGTMSDDTTDDDEVPEIDSQSSSDMSSSDNSSPTVQQQYQQTEPIQYQQFMSLLLLRHMFGSWYLRSNTTTGVTETESMSSYVSGDLGDIGAQCTDVSSEEENEEEEERSEYDNETSETEEEKKDVRNVPRGKMRLRTLKYEDSTVEVFPQLKTESNEEEDDLVLFGPVI